MSTFTAEKLAWQPYLTPLNLADATPAQHEALQISPSGTGLSDYLLVLALDAESLRPRTELFNAILYARGGLPRAERELAATAASVVNRCVYCASVHAARYRQLAHDPETIARLFAAEEAVAEPDARRAAILAFAFAQSHTPPAAGANELAALRAAGLSEAEIVDLILVVGIFAWANRLMHTLGTPHPAP